MKTVGLVIKSKAKNTKETDLKSKAKNTKETDLKPTSEGNGDEGNGTVQE